MVNNAAKLSTLVFDQSHILANSTVCFYALLNNDGSLKFTNEYFCEQFISFPGYNIKFQDLLSTNDHDNFNNILAAKSSADHSAETIFLSLQVGPQTLLHTRWNFARVKQDGLTLIQGIGAVDNNANVPSTSHAVASYDFFNGHAEYNNEEPVADKYKFLFYKNPLPMWIYDVATLMFLDVNEAAIEHYGFTKNEFLSMTIRDIRPAEDIARLMALQQAQNVPTLVHKGLWKHKKKNGTVIDVQITAHLMQMNGRQAKLVLADDRTEQKRAEEELLTSNERYTYASKATFDAIWDWDLKTNKLYFSEGFKMLFGHELNENPGDVSIWSDHIHPEEKERVQQGIFKAINNGALNWTDEYKYIKADGSIAYVTDRGIIIKDDKGTSLRMIGAMQDITIRKVNEQQLQTINMQLLRQQKEKELTASILRSLSEKELLNDALTDILRKLTIFFDFEIGEAWFINLDKKRLELRQKWYAANEMELFYQIHSDVNYKLKEKGSLGKSWNENEIVFIEDVTTYESFVRKEGAIKTGLSRSLGVPIMFKGEPIAVFSFFGKNDIANKDKVRLYFESLSLQLGLDIQRKKTEEELNKFFDLSPDILTIVGFDGYFKKVNKAFSKIIGFSDEEILERPFQEHMHPDDLEISIGFFNEVKSGKTIQFQNRFKTSSSGHKWLSWTATPLFEDGIIYATAKDVTDKMEMDNKLTRILESISDGFFTVDQKSTVLYWNRQAERLLGFKREKVLGKKLFDILKEKVPTPFFTKYVNSLENDISIHVEEYIPIYDAWFEVSAYPFGGILSVFFKDITERKKSDEIIRVSSERYEVLAKATKDAIWDWNLLNNTVTWNEGLKTIFNYIDVSVTNDTSWWHEKLHPEDRHRVISDIKTHIKEHRSNWEAEYRFRCANGTFKYIYDRGFTIYNNDNIPIRMIGSMQDLTETKSNENILRELNNSLEKRAAQLATSNAELESFAYVASHDLQEPLRMVSSFLQLIEKKYSDKLDKKAHEYIGFAVDGAERMKGLILDLLEYSRVNSRKDEKEEVDLNEVADNLMLTYRKAIEEQNGQIKIDKLPVLQGNKLQLTQLFQNLISNALKYRSDAPPIIEIHVEENDEQYKFSVSDNGIGIEPRFYHKIFVIFQRLHSKTDYSGTGIGLAICKKIVELHNGNIWVESALGAGSVFYFTIPKFQLTTSN